MRYKFMLYEKGSLTDEQAKKIIGERMCKRIVFLNDWAKKNGYTMLLHSTFKGLEDNIFLRGLSYPVHSSFDSRNEILESSNIPEQDLIHLEKWVENKGHAGQLSKLYETYPPRPCSTVQGFQQISAKDLLEHNHNGGNITIIFCVPKLGLNRRIGRQRNDLFSMATTRHSDSYLRRLISCKQNHDGNFEYKSEFFYPTQGILCAFDRDNCRIKFNSEFDETFYLDSSTPQKGKIQKGDLSTPLKQIGNIDRQNNSYEIKRKKATITPTDLATVDKSQNITTHETNSTGKNLRKSKNNKTK